MFTYMAVLVGVRARRGCTIKERGMYEWWLRFGGH